MLKEFLKYFVSFVIGIIFILILPKQCSNKHSSENEFNILENRFDSIVHLNNSLYNEIDIKDKKIVELSNYNDSLENLKPKIKQNYVIKFKEIDTLSPTNLVNEYKNIFSTTH